MAPSSSQVQDTRFSPLERGVAAHRGHFIFMDKLINIPEKPTLEWVLNNIELTREALSLVTAPEMDMSNLSTIEKQICDWLVENDEDKLKQFFLADLSWAIEGDKALQTIQEIHGYATNRTKAIVNFFTKRFGKRVYDNLPDDIKNYILANRL